MELRWKIEWKTSMEDADLYTLCSTYLPTLRAVKIPIPGPDLYDDTVSPRALSSRRPRSGRRGRHGHRTPPRGGAAVGGR